MAKKSKSSLAKKEPHICNSVLFNVGGQQVRACSACGRRTTNNSFINLKEAKRIKQK